MTTETTFQPDAKRDITGTYGDFIVDFDGEYIGSRRTYGEALSLWTQQHSKWLAQQAAIAPCVQCGALSTEIFINAPACVACYESQVEAVNNDLADKYPDEGANAIRYMCTYDAFVLTYRGDRVNALYFSVKEAESELDCLMALDPANNPCLEEPGCWEPTERVLCIDCGRFATGSNNLCPACLDKARKQIIDQLGSPEPEPTPPTITCKACSGNHHIQNCPEIGAELHTSVEPAAAQTITMYCLNCEQMWPHTGLSLFCDVCRGSNPPAPISPAAEPESYPGEEDGCPPDCPDQCPEHGHGRTPHKSPRFGRSSV